MIKVKLTRHSEGYFTKLYAKGHAGFDVEGKDIVCAAFSVLTINFINSVTEFTDDDIILDEKDGFIDFRFEGGISDDSKLLCRSYLLGIEAIQEAYGTHYISITFEEVK